MRPRSHFARATIVALLGSVAVLGAASCDEEGEPRPQWTVHIGTDAPLPGFGDRVRVDVLDEDGNACGECTRVFDLRGGEAVPLSFGVVPTGEGVWVRARLFRAESIAASGEPTEPILDVLGRLPDIGAAPMDVEMFLGMDCFGRPADPVTKNTCDPSSGDDRTDLTFEEGDGSAFPAPGSWRYGEEACPPDAPADMVCVPGGTFLLGSRVYHPFGPTFDPVPEQLVHVSPFYLDKDEMTVATFRTVVGSGVPEPVETSEEEPYCAYTADPADREAWSVNCLDRDTAKAACEALGKRLPTEAEWEFAAGGAGLEAPYPWVLTSPSARSLCSQAILARAEILDEGSRQCILIEPDYEIGPAPGGSSADVSFLGANNMGGNLAEWVADDFAEYGDETCWGPDLTLREDPSCVADDSLATVRGGDWTAFIYNAHAYFRRSAPSSFELDFIGVRCAKSAE